MVWVVGRVDVKLYYTDMQCSDMGPKYIYNADFILLAQQLDIAFKLAFNRRVRRNDAYI